MGVSDERATQADAFGASRRDRDRTLAAVHRFETALAMAADGESWPSEVTADLEALATAMDEEQRELERPDALMAMIASEHPRRFKSRVRNLRTQYDDLIRQVRSLQAQFEGEETEGLDADDLRHRAGWIIRALHHARARQTDLVFEALQIDLGERREE